MKMKVYMLWHGGSSCSDPDIDDATEHESIKAAIEFFWEQKHPEVYCCYPEPPDKGGPTARLYFGAPPDGQSCADRELSWGPRGAVRMECV